MNNNNNNNNNQQEPLGNNKGNKVINNRGNNYQSGHGNRFNNNNNNRRNNDKFKGACTAMEGFIYDNHGPDQGDKFIRTTEKLVSVLGEKYGNDVKTSIKNLQKVMYDCPDKPTDPTAEAPRCGEWIWFNEEVKEHMKKVRELDLYLQKSYEIVWGQCTTMLQSKIKSMDGYKSAKDNSDVIALLKLIKYVNYQFEQQKYKYASHSKSYSEFYALRQKEDESVTD